MTIYLQCEVPMKKMKGHYYNSHLRLSSDKSSHSQVGNDTLDGRVTWKTSFRKVDNRLRNVSTVNGYFKFGVVLLNLNLFEYNKDLKIILIHFNKNQRLQYL